VLFFFTVKYFGRPWPWKCANKSDIDIKTERVLFRINDVKIEK